MDGCKAKWLGGGEGMGVATSVLSCASRVLESTGGTNHPGWDSQVTV